MNEYYRPKGCSSALSYKDPKSAYRWLEQAFGFEPLFVILSKEGDLLHSELTFGNSVIMVGTEWTDKHKSPLSIDGINTQTVHMQLEEDVDAHCERARKAGAKILMEPADQFYGDRAYRAEDPEGHIWSFSQTKKKMTPAEWDAVGGCITKTRLD